ncbi:hypothetical protein MHYP_G00078530 [Metynnis hypsauchen]
MEDGYEGKREKKSLSVDCTPQDPFAFFAGKKGHPIFPPGQPMKPTWLGQGANGFEGGGDRGEDCTTQASLRANRNAIRHKREKLQGGERPGSLPSVLRRSPPTCPLTSTLGVLFIIPTAGSLSYLPFPMPHRPPTGLEQCLRLTHAEQALHQG